MEVHNRYVSLKNHINEAPSESDLEIKTTTLSLEPKEGSGDVIVKNLYLSIDPYQVNRMKFYSSSQETSSFSQRLPLGQAIDANGVGEVVASDNAGYKKGDLVAALIGWEEYTNIHGGGGVFRKIESTEFPLSYHVGVLGLSGFTAYAGFQYVCKPKKGDKVFVSTASGSVGSMVGQYAKLAGCYTVGCAGSKKKVDLLKDKLGFDEAFNYRDEPDLKATVKRYFPDGIDIYFDNVGGEMLEAAVANMNVFGRIGVCGAISEYTDSTKRAAPDTLAIIYKRITIQGFLAADYLQSYSEFIKDTSNYLRQGEIHVLEDISLGLESLPSAFVGLFRGDNVGKKIVQVIHD
ncbi:hypothetical protein AMTRI_Chr05g63470 [Amborella trichopoda]|uniref:Enoyl reductase (ER) domain-containing protein n=1 Tax=Amborella trichopoda TaxID=13333 RepID=W1NYG3_AMBTC|nr:2-alkenal reductase (NADP(+)-dependent) [Amborella trichopoda]ERN00341.1 hypothetical protein AMTR_s00104p00050900 [Amborella trichopoda]|eukprot:XP_006837772.1 2-alkenal reductase (NADP(+)-dependent) [Amborella trichopoda]